MDELFGNVIDVKIVTTLLTKLTLLHNRIGTGKLLLIIEVSIFTSYEVKIACYLLINKVRVSFRVRIRFRFKVILQAIST